MSSIWTFIAIGTLSVASAVAVAAGEPASTELKLSRVAADEAPATVPLIAAQ